MASFPASGPYGLSARYVPGGAAGASSSSADDRMAAPPDCPIRARDVVQLPNGQVYEVDGEPDDQTLGHHGWKPGIVLWLKRVTG